MTGTARHEKIVHARFDDLEARFKASVAPDDVRLTSLLQAIGPLAGSHVLDLGCGKGRFGRRFRDLGARVVGLDPSGGMLANASGMDRVRGSALRLPFAPETFDAAVAVEVFQHLPPGGPDAAISEAFRVLRPGGILAIVDRNALALDARRPYLPSLLLKQIDQKRGRWMYPSGGPVRERWSSPRWLAQRLRRHSSEVAVEHLLSPDEARRLLFRLVPAARAMALWTARKPGGPARG